MRAGKAVFRTISFLLVLAFAIWAIPQSIFGMDNSAVYFRAKDFYKEKNEALDAVFVGASNVYAFWQPAIGWQARGIAVYNLAFGSLPFTAVDHLIAEARRTQPNALYIINLSTFKTNSEISSIENYHRVVDYMPFTLEKIRFIHKIAGDSGFSLADEMELLFPFIRFHSRWNRLESWCYGAQEGRYKESLSKSGFEDVVDIGDKIDIYADERDDLNKNAMEAFTDLLDYLDREHVNALFVKVPQATRSVHQGRMNVMEDMVTSRGYPCLDMLSGYEEVGIIPQRDFFNRYHTNIRGSSKLTRYLADYLVEHYHFTDKRGQADYADWDREAEAYDKFVDTWILPFEREKILWQDLPAPKIKEAKAKRSGIRLTWSASKGADGYVIYRKTAVEDDGHWKLVATVGTDKLSYVDSELQKNTKYTYVIAPFVDKGGQKAYGNYNIKGASCTSPKELGQSSAREKTPGQG